MHPLRKQRLQPLRLMRKTLAAHQPFREDWCFVFRPHANGAGRTGVGEGSDPLPQGTSRDPGSWPCCGTSGVQRTDIVSNGDRSACLRMRVEMRGPNPIGATGPSTASPSAMGPGSNQNSRRNLLDSVARCRRAGR